MFGVKNIYSGLLAVPQVIITISHRKAALENEICVRAVVLVYILTPAAVESIYVVLLQSYLRSFKIIQPSSYLNDPTIIKPKNSTFFMNDFIKMTDINTCLVQLYLISLSCIVEEYSTSRARPQALRLCLISSRALLCWQLSACRKGQRPNISEQREQYG